jgi:hypothetical protein
MLKSDTKKKRSGKKKRGKKQTKRTAADASIIHYSFCQKAGKQASWQSTQAHIGATVSEEKAASSICSLMG